MKIGEFSDAPNIHLSQSELEKLAGAEKVRKMPIVEKLEVERRSGGLTAE